MGVEVDIDISITSALHDNGVDELWDVVEEFVKIMREKGEFWRRREQQRKLWMWGHIDWQLASR